MPHRFHHHMDQVLSGLVEVFERLAIGLRTCTFSQICLNILYRRFESIQTIMKLAKFVLGHNYLSGRNLQLIRPSTGLISPLAVGTATEQAGPARTRGLSHGTATPPAPITVR